MSAKIHAIETANGPRNDKYQALIGSIKTCLHEKLSNLISQMLNSADDMLFQFAENADSNEEQNQYFDTMRMIRLERQNIKQNFSDALTAYLKPAVLNPANGIEAEEEELSLIDQDTMEEMVAISTMHSKVMSQCGESVNHLEARLEVLAMKSTHVFDKQALIPRHICEAFQKSLTSIELDTRNKLILFKLFDQQVCSQLTDVYQAINKLLIDEGILPQIKLGNSTNRTHTPNRNSTTATLESNQHEQFTMPGQQIHSPGMAASNIEQVIHNFLYGSGSSSVQNPGTATAVTGLSSTAHGSPTTQYYDRRDVLKALSGLQKDNTFTVPQNNQLSLAGFKQALISNMGRRHGGAITKQVNQVDEKTIDLIEMLFEVIVEDQSISDAVTNLILRLQIPVVKSAMLDQAFFANGNHPARNVLNIIASMSKGVTDKTDDLYQQIEQVVNGILEEFDVDVISFQNALDKLNEINLQHNDIIEENERQTQKLVLQEHARQVVLSELKHHARNSTIPKAVQPLILKHWSTLMFHRYLHHGKNSNEWNESIDMLDKLLQSLKPVKRADIQNYHNELILLADEASSILHHTRQDPSEINSAINALCAAHEHLVSELLSLASVDINTQFGDETNNTTDTFTDFYDTDSFDSLPEIKPQLIEPDPMEEQARLARETMAKLPREVKPGVWFELYNGESSSIRRLKLSVLIMDEAKLIFVDRLGVKKMEKNATEFMVELEAGQSQLIADHSVFDHALSHVITSLAAAR